MFQDSYFELNKKNILSRLPLEGSIDLTYRCNNNCRHCWLRIAPDTKEKKKELQFEVIKRVLTESKIMGCKRWIISGGEPMIRPDFLEVFDFITCQFNSYSINTNGTLITPKIAKLMKRKGSKMVALYGATAKVHDHITRNCGSFDLTMRGFSYLKEAGAGFIVQLVPMKDNYHQFGSMVELAESLSKHYRIGAPWLWLSANGKKVRNEEIMRQRLPAKDIVELNKPNLPSLYWLDIEKEIELDCRKNTNNSFLFSSCIKLGHSFHIDPYGMMTFCKYIKKPAMRYNLNKGSFRKCWEVFLPSLARKIKINEKYKKNCGSCDLRKDCNWCPAHSYLEHRKFDAKANYLCSVAKKCREYKNYLQENHRRYFKIANITIQVDSDLPFTENTFLPKFKNFETNGPGKDNIAIRHHFYCPDLNGVDLGKELYRRAPWAVYKKSDSWMYLGISSNPRDKSLSRVAVFNSNHAHAEIYNRNAENFTKGNLYSLTLFTTDQILLARILADRQGCYLHSCGVNYKGKGLLFAGHSEAGKSTMASMLKDKAEILCDDRMIIRRQPQGFQIYGTWSHGDVSSVSANSAPLKAILFLKKANRNHLTLLKDKKEITKKFWPCLIKPLVTADWWEKTFLLMENILEEIPCYVLEFDKSGMVTEELKKL